MSNRNASAQAFRAVPAYEAVSIMTLSAGDDPFQSLSAPPMAPARKVAPKISRKLHPFSAVPIAGRDRKMGAGDSNDVVARVDAELGRTSVLTRELHDAIEKMPVPPTVQSAPIAEPEPMEQIQSAKKDARDAWRAVFVMGVFIVGGIMWSHDRIANSEAKIGQLTLLLQAERTAAMARVSDMRKLQIEVAAIKSARAKVQTANSDMSSIER